MSLAVTLPVVVANPTSPITSSKAKASADIYWDEKLVRGAIPYPLIGKSLDGKKVALNNYKGKVVLLDFWATWCGPCVNELPNVLKNYRKYHNQGFEILGLSNDSEKDDLTKFIAYHKITWPQVYERDNAGGASNTRNYGVQGIPFMLLVGKDGKIAAVNPIGEALEPAIKIALAK